MNPVSIRDDAWQEVTRVWTVWLRGLFSVQQQGSFRWLPDDDTSEIYIAGQEPEDAGNKRPRILVSRGPVGYAGTSINQTVGRSTANQSFIFSDLEASNIVITSAASLGAEAQFIARYIFRMVGPFRPILTRQAKLHSILTNNMSLSSEQDLSSLHPGSPVPNFRAVQVVVPVYLQENLIVDNSSFFPAVENFVMSTLRK